MTMLNKKLLHINNKIKQFKPEIFKFKFKYLDDGGMLKDNNSKKDLAELIKNKLRQKNIYKDDLFYAGYDSDKYKNLVSTGVANTSFLQDVMVSFLYEPDEFAINYERDALSFSVDELNGSDDIIIAVYDLPHIDYKNHYYIHEVPLDKTHPLKGLIAIFKIHINFVSY